MKQEKANRKAILYSTHYMEEAEQLCDRIVLLDCGRIVAQGSLDELRDMTGGSNLREIFRVLMNGEV